VDLPGSITGRVSKAAILILIAGGLAASLGASAQDADGGRTWENATELGFVSTGGNEFKLELGGIRGETNTTTRTATGTAGSFTVNETMTSQLTAESYFARGRYDRNFSSAYSFSGVGWDRNTFAGVQNRYSMVVGVGRTWADGDTGRLKTDIGGTYTIQKDVDPAPGADDAFSGVRITVDATRRLWGPPNLPPR